MRVPYRAVALTIAFSTACSILGVGALAQQGPRRGPQLEKPTNLQVLPKDISTQDLLKTMRGFTVDLGVRCTFCHAEDPQTHRINFALDTKPEKNTARVMLRMTHAINTQYLATLPGGEAKVTCYTCHRGSSMPVMQPPPRAEGERGPGAGPSGPPPASPSMPPETPAPPANPR